MRVWVDTGTTAGSSTGSRMGGIGSAGRIRHRSAAACAPAPHHGDMNRSNEGRPTARPH